MTNTNNWNDSEMVVFNQALQEAGINVPLAVSSAWFKVLREFVLSLSLEEIDPFKKVALHYMKENAQNYQFAPWDELLSGFSTAMVGRPLRDHLLGWQESFRAWHPAIDLTLA